MSVNVAISVDDNSFESVTNEFREWIRILGKNPETTALLDNLFEQRRAVALLFDINPSARKSEVRMFVDPTARFFSLRAAIRSHDVPRIRDECLAIIRAAR